MLDTMPKDPDCSAPPSPLVGIDLPVRGMTCASCSTRLERVLSRLPGVAEASVSLAAERASARFNPGQVSAAAIAEAIAKAGFEVPGDTIELAVSSMTCASCSARVEKVLGKVPGVRAAAVNLATERASVEVVPGAVSASALIAAVERAGYGASVVVDAADRVAAEEAEKAAASRRDLVKLGIAALLTAPLVMQMVVELMGSHAFMLSPLWQMALATPVQFWIGARFYVGAWKSLRGGAGEHGSAGGDGHHRSLWPQRLADRYRPGHRPPVFRGVGGGHHAGAAGQVAGGAGQGQCRRRHPRPDEAAA
jgi:copper ion binding protein